MWSTKEPPAGTLSSFLPKLLGFLSSLHLGRQTAATPVPSTKSLSPCSLFEFRFLPPECSGSMSFSFILLILFRDGVSPGDSGLLGLVCTDFIPHRDAGPHDRAQNGCRRHLAVTQLTWSGTNWLGNSWAGVSCGTLVQEVKINGILKTKRLRVKLTQESLN